MVYALGIVLIAIICFLLVRRSDPRVATINSLPTYGTAEAAGLQEAICRKGAAQLVAPADSASPFLKIEPARSKEYFRERMSTGKRPLGPPAALRRARNKPVKPKPFSAPRARAGSAPPQTLLVPASRCRICGRPLTNADSRRRGVGPDCYKSHGPRVVHAANPAFAEWSIRKETLDAQQAAWQSLLDELFKQLMERFETEMENWSEASRTAA